MKIRRVSLKQAKFIAHQLASELLSYDEPIPEFDTRFPGRLESCLETPFQYFSGKPLYRYLPHRAAVLFYLIIKNHPFANGNKRLAVTITLVFFYFNKKWINVSANSLYEIACRVADSKPSEKENHIRALTIFFKSHMIDRV